jgi:hypothetical protein
MLQIDILVCEAQFPLNADNGREFFPSNSHYPFYLFVIACAPLLIIRLIFLVEQIPVVVLLLAGIADWEMGGSLVEVL